MTTFEGLTEDDSHFKERGDIELKTEDGQEAVGLNFPYDDGDTNENSNLDQSVFVSWTTDLDRITALQTMTQVIGADTDKKLEVLCGDEDDQNGIRHYPLEKYGDTIGRFLAEEAFFGVNPVGDEESGLIWHEAGYMHDDKASMHATLWMDSEPVVTPLFLEAIRQTATTQITTQAEQIGARILELASDVVALRDSDEVASEA